MPRPARAAPPPERICVHCALPFRWRKKWERVWDRVRFCSERCRRSHSPRANLRIESAVVARLSRSRGTICPSEVSRELWPSRWRAGMERVRAAARRLERLEVVHWTQRGRRVDPATAHGAIRLARGPRFSARERD